MSRFVLPFSFLILFNIQLPVFGEKRDAKRVASQSIHLGRSVQYGGPWSH